MKRLLFVVLAVLVVNAAFFAGYIVGRPTIEMGENGKMSAMKTENAVVTNLPPQMAVMKVEYGGDDAIRLILSEQPDMEVARHYISVEPMNQGSFNCGYETWYDWQTKKYQSALRVQGDFAYRTNVTLRLRKGFPLCGNGKDVNSEGALTNDFTFVFRRKDANPTLDFAAKGRYLPPGGKRMVEIESVNVSNVVAEISRIEPRNVVQLLAREERQYRSKRWSESADEEDTEELSGDCALKEFRCRNFPNQKEVNRLAVKLDDGGPDNGMYLVMIRNSDIVRNENAWYGVYNPNVYRVICVSDLGLSVRWCDNSLGVWVTSLMTGRSIGGAKVEVYSSANILLGEGVCDQDGWCAPEIRVGGNPFAVVVRSASGDDMTFLALRDSMKVPEDENNGGREMYLNDNECTAFLWTERGIYRHDERIFIHGIVRNNTMKAPSPMPLELELRGPDGKPVLRSSVMSDENGVVMSEEFAVPAERPSGEWTIVVKIPGKDGNVLGSRKVKIEEFAPPQIRVRIAADESLHPSNLTFRISAEHLFGGPARQLDCEGAVVFEDVAFAPAKWKGWKFGNENLGLKPSYRKLSQRVLDDKGECEYFAPLFADSGLPKAAIRATFEGVAFEDGGRPATSRKSIITHYYPYYIGSNLGSWVKLPKAGYTQADFVLVDTKGEAVCGIHSLTARLERIDCVYTYRRNGSGGYEWDCNRIDSVIVEGVEIKTEANGRASYALPVRECGDYLLTVSDGCGGSFSQKFYLSDWGDDVVRAPLSDPTSVTIVPDKPFYRVGETPRLLVKSPFAGWAMISVIRDGAEYFGILNLTNATSEVLLTPTVLDWAPNVDVYISVVQSVSENTKHLAARAHGQTTVVVRPAENEVEVKLDAKLEGQKLGVDIDANGAAYAVVTVVDEGINLLTSEPVPDPIGYFAQPRRANHPLYDIFHRVLPVVDENLRVNGVKTGGGFGAEMLGRVSPEPTRRFKPLALWKSRVQLHGGKGHTEFTLPEFVGEVRVTAVAYSGIATGSTSIQRKIAPNLIVQPDAPRFVAPGDAFTVTMPLRNTTKNVGCVAYQVGEIKGEVGLLAGASTNLVLMMTAPNIPGQLPIKFVARGFGETHEQIIELPVRPAVAWCETAGVARVNEEASLRAAVKEGEQFAAKVCNAPTDELFSAYRWLADYPHGCLEQTSSRIFPLLSGGLGVVSNRQEYIEAGVRRVESMIRENDFVMWPDCDYAPWDCEVSLYASHFLIESERSGILMSTSSKMKIMKFLSKWSVSTNDSISAYACHTLALAGKPDRDQMLQLYDRAKDLDALSRARIARAFALDRDFKRAEKLLEYVYDPQNIREASFTVLAMLEVNPDDARIFPLVEYLVKSRDGERFSWVTTGDNAHALLAIGAYYRAHPGMEKEPYLLWRKLTLPEAAEVKDNSSGIFIDRKYYRANGELADLTDLVRGEMLIVELSLTTDVTRVVNDLVIEDLFPACFEPVHSSTFNLQPSTSDWVMREDARDDRMLIFSKRFTIEKDNGVKVRYPVRVVTAGDFVLPGPSVEGMYNPRLHSRRAPGRIVVRR